MTHTPAKIIHKGLLNGLTRWEKVIAYEMTPDEMMDDGDARGIKIFTAEGDVVQVITRTVEDANTK